MGVGGWGVRGRGERDFSVEHQYGRTEQHYSICLSYRCSYPQSLQTELTASLAREERRAQASERAFCRPTGGGDPFPTASAHRRVQARLRFQCDCCARRTAAAKGVSETAVLLYTAVPGPRDPIALLDRKDKAKRCRIGTLYSSSSFWRQKPQRHQSTCCFTAAVHTHVLVMVRSRRAPHLFNSNLKKTHTEKRALFPLF